MKRLRAMAVVVMLALAANANAVVFGKYEFDDAEQLERYQQLIYELRCLVCQNQNLADSNAELAGDLRREVHRLILEGKSDQDVIDFMVARYGDFVLYRPPLKAKTVLLWSGPFVLGIGALVLLLVQLRRRAEDAAGGGRVEPPVVMVRGVERQAQADLDLIAGDDGGDQVLARGVPHLGGGERGRHDGRGGVQRARSVGVVEIERMGEGSVDQRRGRRGVGAPVARNRAGPGGKTEAFHGRDQAGRRFGVVPGADRDARDVEDQALGPFDHLGGQILVTQIRRKGCQLSRNPRHDRHPFVR